MAVSCLQGAGRNNGEEQVRTTNGTDAYHRLTCGLSAWSIESKIFWLNGDTLSVGSCKIGELSRFLVAMNYTDNAPNIRSLSPQSTSLCKIFRLNGDTFGVDGGEIGAFEQRDHVCLYSLK
jgi:hypothetical protein